jgi:hypothetical protein
LDFRGASNNVKLGFAATGKTTNDIWNVVSFPWQNLGTVESLKTSDGAATPASVTLANGGGYWFNSTGDHMFDSYVYPNGGGGDGVGNLTVTVSNLVAGQYHVYLYGNAYPHPGDPTSRGECDTIFSASSGGNNYGPTGTTLSAGWTSSSQLWVEGKEYVRFHNVQVVAGQPLVITGAPGYNGQPANGPEHPASLNGIQIQQSSTSPIASFANGSFESPVFSAGGHGFASGSTDISHWVTGGPGMVSIVNGPASPSVNPEDGAQQIVFNGGNTEAGATLSQTFATSVGQTYTVSFYVGRVGTSDGTMSLQAQVTSGSGAVLGSASAVAPGTQGYGSVQTFNFTATTEVSTLMFTDTSTATVAVDLLLDNVRVEAGSGSCVTPPSGLVDWWPGNGNANDVVGSNNGTPSGGASFTAGEVGQAFDLNGSDSQINFGNSAGNFGTNDFTVEFWLKTTSTRHEAVMGKWPVCGYASMWEIGIGGASPWSGPGRLEGTTCSDTSGNDYNSISAGKAINDGLFHHVAFVRRGTNVVFYVDGVLDVASNLMSGSISRIDNTANLVAGRSVCVGIDGTFRSPGSWMRYPPITGRYRKERFKPFTTPAPPANVNRLRPLALRLLPAW